MSIFVHLIIIIHSIPSCLKVETMGHLLINAPHLWWISTKMITMWNMLLLCFWYRALHTYVCFILWWCALHVTTFYPFQQYYFWQLNLQLTLAINWIFLFILLSCSSSPSWEILVLSKNDRYNMVDWMKKCGCKIGCKITN